MAVATHSIEINASPAAVYAVITDFQSYPSFVPNQVGATVLSSTENAWQVEFELSVAKRLRYVLDLVGTPDEAVRWSLVRGDMMKEMAGGWRLEALPDGRTRAHYDIDVALKGFVPRSISRALIERTLPANMDAFKKEVERRG
jgi:ribosome-associated toxin RatA of RatAB toxin-antitoxin module